ncbi:PilX N-terminal domain-containing pilus assembly protein [Rudaea sp.]|uniref:PilX N-terminal domain-containing pilus assembly protein n=1 Tax=Rudaea sp. TaxID=2136325 RepID=UPI002ED37B47
MNSKLQSGTTLIVTLMLLLLASLLALFAMNAGILEQRTSASDVRARLVKQTVEAAISQGAEYIKANRSIINPTNGKWTRCGGTNAPPDTNFPCGAVPQCVAGQYSGTGCASPSMQRRGNMYYYNVGASYDVNGNNSTSDDIDTRSIPLDRRMTTVGNGYAVNYGVGVVMCMVKTPAQTTDPTECTTDLTQASGTYLFTVIGVGNIAGESANTTLSTTFGISPIAGGGGNLPPITASGSVDVTGGIQVVTNSNGAGKGVPVSVWTRQALTKTGTPNTCYFEDYIRNQGNVPGQGSVDFAKTSTGGTSSIITCDTCSCSNSISYQSSGNGGNMGIDLLDIDSVPVVGTSTCTSTLQAAGSCKSNANVRSNEFPCDLFNYVFHVQAWEDDTGTNPDGYCTDGHDCFCETRKMTTTAYQPADNSPLPSGGIGVDEAWLYNHATQIIPGTLHSSGWIKPDKLAACSALADSGATNGTTAQGGLIWVQNGATCSTNNVTMGTPDLPVIVVWDGNVSNFHGKLYGLLFIRAPNSPLDPTTGGSTDGSGGSLTMQAGSVIYGSVVIQGQFIKGNGTAAIVYLPKVLAGFTGEPTLNPASPVPGSWTDRFSY